MSKEKNEPKKMSELSDDQLELAKSMYLEHYSVSEISKRLNVPRTSVSYHANRYWKEEKDLLKAELFAQFTENKRMHFTRMKESSITIISRALSELAQRNVPPTVVEAKKATEILESLDKITRLDDNSPTEIVEERPISVINLQKKINLDPFSQTEIADADYEEIKKLPENTDDTSDDTTITKN